jgi:hypothetical protein
VHFSRLRLPGLDILQALDFRSTREAPNQLIRQLVITQTSIRDDRVMAK